MKTIEVSDEMYDQLIALSNEMNNQDHRCTAMPYFFQVRETKRSFGIDEDYSDEYVWVNSDCDGTVDNDRKSMIEALESQEVAFDEKETISEDDLESLMEAAGYRKGYFRNEEILSNAFLTEKSCKEHIRKNGYHYSAPTDYLSHAFRNPDLELVSKFICGLTGKEMHT